MITVCLVGSHEGEQAKFSPTELECTAYFYPAHPELLEQEYLPAYTEAAWPRMMASLD